MAAQVCSACGRHLDAGFQFCDACAAPVLVGPSARADDSPLLHYRPELDGIRALAVLGVMLSHTAILLGIEDRARWLAALALGVDAFFVLSGYLITTLLLREIRAFGRVDLRAFYARRMLRLIPALLLLILIVGAISWTWEGFNSSGLPYAGLAALVVLYVGNWFIPFLGPNLLRHTWSLALEEQYYIIWPGLLVYGLRRGKSWRFLAWSCVGAAAFVVVLRFVADAFLPVAEGPDRLSISFTWTVMRADGVLIGSALGLALDAGHDRLLRILRRPITPLAGAGLVIFGLCAFHFWSGVFSSIPRVVCFAVAGVTMFLGHVVSHPNSLVNTILRDRLLVRIGRISYGLYLFHFPVFALFASDGISSLGEIVVMFVAAFGLAALSFVFVERPALRLKARFRPRAA